VILKKKNGQKRKSHTPPLNTLSASFAQFVPLNKIEVLFIFECDFHILIFYMSHTSLMYQYDTQQKIYKIFKI